jgi:hypothetical protein
MHRIIQNYNHWKSLYKYIYIDFNIFYHSLMHSCLASSSFSNEFSNCVFCCCNLVSYPLTFSKTEKESAAALFHWSVQLAKMH